MSCFFKSSSSVKSSFFRSRTRFPFLSRATTLTSTSSVITRMRLWLAGAGGDCWAVSGIAPGKSSATITEAARFFLTSRMFIASEPEPRSRGHTPHVACPCHLAKRERVHHRIDGRKVDIVEDVVGGKPQVQGPRFLDGNRFVESHVQRDLSRPFNDVSPGIAEGGAVWIDAREAWRTKSGGIEPFPRRRAAKRNGLSRNNVGAQRTTYAAANVQGPAQHPRSEAKPRADREVAAPLPGPQHVSQGAFCHEVPVLSNRQIVNPVACEFVALVEAGKPAVGGNVERILRHHASPTANRRSIVNRFGIRVLRAQADSFGHALADSHGAGMEDGIALGGFVNKRLDGLASRRCRS